LGQQQSQYPSGEIQPILNHIHNTMKDFEWTSYTHIYMELNEIVDGYQRMCLELEPGTFIVQEYFKDNICEENTLWL
jgi:hypothetical protein